ncbi:MAG: DedA family protein [Gammaproteobacteria bacterium]|nr:DedA family protein [Gammaproteobacteria bacterium]MBU2059805.1 DedA family protein [Gammaproteobacteria bacterium]MBU2175415.1 DedA family protein [Gammaproteobacteria bacterium]MBU2245677.1 DedA family protein [Gammaproteobacteria bacterium]MBU2343134.1 DedA family protein [Gammaproteobacteria bacterium]
MKIFQWMYDKALVWARHRHAERYLAGLSFTESVIFPIPPDVMLAPMALAQPEKAWRFAWVTTLFSVLGGICGYFLGLWLYEPVVLPVVEYLGYQETFAKVEQWFMTYGVWVVFIAGFSPIPYKLFTVGAGLMSMAFFPFVIASFVGRASRFFLVAGLMYWGGEKMQQKLRDIVDWLGWGTVALAGVLYLVYR